MENPDSTPQIVLDAEFVLNLRQAVKDGPGYVCGGWPAQTMIPSAAIDGNLISQLGAGLIAIRPTNGEAEYRIVSESAAVGGSLLLELQPGSIYEPEPTMIDPVDVLAQYAVPPPSDEPRIEGAPDDTREADAAALAATILGETGANIVLEPKPVQEPLLQVDVGGPTKAEVLAAIAKITGDNVQDVSGIAPVVAAEPVTALASTTIGDAVPGLVIPDDATLDESTDEGLVILMVKHLESAAATSRDHAISLLKAARDEASKAVGEVMAEVEAVVAMIEGVAQDGSTKGSTWNMTHQLWVMPKAS